MNQLEEGKVYCGLTTEKFNELCAVIPSEDEGKNLTGEDLILFLWKKAKLREENEELYLTEEKNAKKFKKQNEKLLKGLFFLEIFPPIACINGFFHFSLKNF